MTATLPRAGPPGLGGCRPGCALGRAAATRERRSATGRSSASISPPARSSAGPDVGGQASYLLHVGDRLLASVEHVGGERSGPSLIVALDWRSGRICSCAGSSPGRSARSRSDGGRPVGAAGSARQRSSASIPARWRRRPLRFELSPGRSARAWPSALATSGSTAADAGEVLRIDPATRTITRVHVGGVPGRDRRRRRERLVRRPRARHEVVRLEPRTLRPIGDPIRRRRRAGWLGHGRPLPLRRRRRRRDGDADRRALGEEGRAADPRRASPPRSASAFAVAPAGRVGLGEQLRLEHAHPHQLDADGRCGPAPSPLSSGQQARRRARALPRGAKVVARRSRIPPGGGGLAVGEGAVWAMSDVDVDADAHRSEAERGRRSGSRSRRRRRRRRRRRGLADPPGRRTRSRGSTPRRTR